MKTMESQRMSWSLADVTRIHGEVGLSAGQDMWCENVPVIYPDDDPTASEHLVPEEIVPQENDEPNNPQHLPSPTQQIRFPADSVRQQQRPPFQPRRNIATRNQAPHYEWSRWRPPVIQAEANARAPRSTPTRDALARPYVPMQRTQQATPYQGADPSRPSSFENRPDSFPYDPRRWTSDGYATERALRR